MILNVTIYAICKDLLVQFQHSYGCVEFFEWVFLIKVFVEVQKDVASLSRRSFYRRSVFH